MSAITSDDGGPRHPLRNEISGFISYPDRFRGWYAPAIDAAVNLSRMHPVDAVFASGPPWTALRVARAVAKRLRCKLITDFRDPWTRRMGFIPGHEPRIYSAWAERDEQAIIGISDAVLFNSPDLMANARKSGLYAGATFHCLLNGTDVGARGQENGFSTTQPLVLRHLGSLYGGRSVAPLLDAIRGSRVIDRSRLRVELIGGDKRNSVRDTGPASPELRVEYLPAIPHSEAIVLMAEPAILLAVQSYDFAAQIPTKIYEYLRTGNPLLVLAAADSAVWRLASQFERCHRLDFEDVEWNRSVLDQLYHQWSRGFLRQVATDKDTARFSKSVVGRQFAEIVRSVLDARQPPRRRQSATAIIAPRLSQSAL
jgi:hypothetical protein